jgi:hypothetical protein
MRKESAKAGEQVGRKRLLAYGRKINGTWEVRTFLRAAAGGGRRTFWEARDHGSTSSKRGRCS